ncbi:hypothetical protein [Halarchaeum nitratireducens]|uniref:Transcription factor zinc-finger domain-containing protein n=1 Tax=Halarchaeum nitratireducens TaxID=489913 RepID=A0A830G6I7_9EURY|nr:MULTISPECIES: hypothetical protein [Halarchaeum]MBP2252031.1 DNA-directed RNA polymerase subunit RPC12/RpoP [Halarchaeum solikamskense]GGN05319.1 hypothetical protein GCM10009021_00170 [Halarchaeum nitratireducens]
MADTREEGSTCPRCGGDLETFVFEGKRAVVCEDCGYADVPADHSPPERADEESWASILRRYRRGGSGDTTDSDGADDGTA